MLETIRDQFSDAFDLEALSDEAETFGSTGSSANKSAYFRFFETVFREIGDTSTKNRIVTSIQKV